MNNNIRTIQLVTEDAELLIVAEVYWTTNEDEEDPQVLLVVRNHVGIEYQLEYAPDDESDPEYQKLMVTLGKIRDALLGAEPVLDLRPPTPPAQYGEGLAPDSWAHTQQH